MTIPPKGPAAERFRLALRALELTFPVLLGDLFAQRRGDAVPV